MDSPSSSAVDAPKKRVLPSRSRRGICDSDLLILETYKRQYEVQPLIHLDTPFLLSTDSQAAVNTASNSEAGIHINVVANDRYFARPEVLKAFREQELIQTPEFESIEESSYVGTRTRPRPEDATIDTSDAAYEKRHRKFETLEKRQRIREKEKLQYEHHKLKVRVEQLKGMDGSAFMTIPASYFSPAPPQATAELNELVASGSPYAQVNGAISSSEGERRRKEMLETARKLEARYAYLLPPDRVRKNKDQQSDSGSKVPSESRDEYESESERALYQAGTSRRDESMKFRIPARSSASTTPAPSPGGPKPSMVKKPKPRAGGASKQVASSRLRRESVSTTPSVALFPEQETSTNDYIDVDMHDPDQIPPSTPGPYDEDDFGQINVSTTNGTSKATEGNGRLRNGKGKGMARMDRGHDEDGESEKALSDDEALEETEDAHEQEPKPEPVVPTPAKRGRKKKVQEPVLPAEGLGDSEVKEISARLEQTTFGSGQPTQGTDGDTTEDMSIPPSLPFEQTESISTAMRPHKRHKTSASSIRTPSAQPGDSGSVATRKYHTTKGKPFATYTDSITGEKVTTTCMLMVAAVRKNRYRATKSFGTDTPKFLDVIEFEYPEWVHDTESETGSPRPAQPDLPLSGPTQAEDQNDVEISQSAPEERVDDAHDDAPTASANIEPGTMDTSGNDEPTIPEGEPQEEPQDMNVDQPEVVEEDKTKNDNAIPQESNSIQEEDQEEDVEPQVEEDNDPVPPADDTESEPRIKPRVLSRPAEDEDEQLEW